MFFPFALNPVPMNTTKKQWAWLFFVTVVWLIISSLRGGGDQWDNPRYRVILLPAILLLVTLAIANVRSSHPVILRKILVVEALNILIFCHWYSWRYAGFGFNLGIRNTILLSMLVSALILFGEMARPKPKRSTRV
jgi:heme A synthase